MHCYALFASLLMRLKTNLKIDLGKNRISRFPLLHSTAIYTRFGPNGLINRLEKVLDGEIKHTKQNIGTSGIIYMIKAARF